MTLRPFFVLCALLASTLAGADLKTAPGFAAELLYQVPRDTAGSWVALAVDPRGRLIVSDQYGPLHRVTPPALGTAGPPRVERLDLPLGSAHGLAFVGDTLYAVVAGKVHGGPGLFRVRDTDRDGDLDEVTLLRALEGTGEHGPHSVIPAPDGKSLYIVGGNATRLPPLARAAARPTWSDAALLPRVPALVGSETRGLPPGGWICQTDLAGETWTLLSAGYRNHYDAAFNRDGELFTVDSDTENDLNLPWYRPTRVLHAVSGADFGWRPGAAKLPEDSPETLPPVLALGLGSPTGVAFGYGAKFPARYTDALFVADWSYGKLLAVHLRPDGASYRGEREEIVGGAPLPLTDLAVSPHDGALYFLTGGRRMHSALYRLTWTGGAETPAADGDADPGGGKHRAARRALERFHGFADPAAVAEAWPHLGSADRFLRGAALRALESQPAAAWRDRALAESEPRAALAALLALARDDAGRRTVLATLDRWPLASLPRELALEKIRLAARCAAGLTLTADERAALLRECDPRFPDGDPALDAALGELLGYLGAPRLVERLLAQLAAAPVRETQIAHAATLRSIRTGWTSQTRARYFRWFRQAEAYRGGAAFRPTLARIRADALATLTADERAAIQPILEAPADASPAPVATFLDDRTPAHAWTVAELAPQLEAALRAPRDPARGRTVFGAVGCFACHAVGGEGGMLGPDLTAARGRFGVRDLLEAILEPSKEIGDQYGTVVVTLADGTVHQGRLVNQTEKQVHVNANLFDPTDVRRLDRAQVRDVRPAAVSLMPPGLLDRLRVDEIADLVAFVYGDRPN